DITMTNLDVANSAALSGIDTLVMYATCDIGNHPAAMTAINAFLDSGHKIIILDGGQCIEGNGGHPDYSTFRMPFTSNGVQITPQYGPLPYTSVEASTLTAHLPDCTPAPGCNEPGNAVADASILTADSNGWCQSIGGTDTNGISGAVEAYGRPATGGG